MLVKRTCLVKTITFLLMMILNCCRPSAVSLIDPRSPNEKAWDSAYEHERSGKVDSARIGYRSLCQKDMPYVRACFDYARISYITESSAQARSISFQTLYKYPNEGLSQSLVKRIAQSFIDDDEGQRGIDELNRLAEKLNKTEIYDTLIYEAAKLCHFIGRFEQETAFLKIIVDEHSRWKSQLWDDSLWRLSQIAKDKNLVNEEIVWLEMLLKEQTSSRLIGSYYSPFRDKALYRLGEINLDKKLYNKAIEYFMELASIKTSRMRDDALLAAAIVEMERGKKSRACDLIKSVFEIGGSATRAAKEKATEFSCPE